MDFHVTKADLQRILGGEGGIDLEPIRENGKQVAMRIVGVKPGTTAAKLGAQNDDTIETINDIPLTSVPAAYAAGEKALHADRIVIRGKRAGHDYETTLTLVDASP